jgi:hypothetical protein
MPTTSAITLQTINAALQAIRSLVNLFFLSIFGGCWQLGSVGTGK